jgi:gas vesicle protein
MNEQQNNGSARQGGNGFIGGFVAGAIAGAILAYVIMQEDARDLIVGKAREAGNMAKDATDDLRDLYQRGKDVVDSARSNVSDAAGEAQSTSDLLKDDLTHKASET